MQYNTNIDISGGNKVIKYFVSGGAFRQNGNVRNFDDNYDAGNRVVNSNYYYRRYNFRSNLDVQASKSLKLRLDLTGRFYQINRPYAGNIVSEIYDWSKIHPYSAPLINPNGSYAYATDTKSKLPTINARLATKGYDLDRQHDMNMLLGGTEDLNGITKGLSFSGRIAYASVQSNTRELFRDDPPSYLYDPVTGAYTLNGSAYVLGNYTLRAYQGQYNGRLNIQAFFNYDRIFGNNHFTSLLLYNRETYNDKNAGWIPANFKGFSFKGGYDYKQKYLLNVVASYNGSDRFQANKRYGFFPAVSVGYNIAEEPFFRDRFHFVDLMKIRASYGVVGSDVTPGNRYLYEQTYNQGFPYSFGETDNEEATITEGNLGNPEVTWEKQKEMDIGIDVNAFDSKFSLTVDYFNNVRYDQLTTPQNIPLLLGIGISPENIARVRNKGFDGQLSYHNNIGKIAYNITGVFSYAKNRILYMDESAPAYPWLAVTGRPIGQPFGYTFIGYYQNQEDINKSAKPNTGSAIVPGDLKYKDLNGDGVIDQYDEGPIGKPNLPNSTAGLTLGLNYKGFSLSLLFQGAWGYSMSVVGTGIEPFQSQFQPIHQQAWTPDNAANAKFPRLTTNPTTINSPSAYMSDFWLINVVYVRLKTLEIGYQLPDKWLPLKINNARFYLSSYNLLTWKNYSLYQQDPEIASNTAGDAYLNQRVVNVGVQVGL
jgi:TonB-linked SusC/RagA family outer membrane protein